MVNIRWDLPKKVEDWYLNRVEKILRQNFELLRAAEKRLKIAKHPVDITALTETDLNIIAVYFAKALTTGDEDYTVWNWLLIDCFANNLQQARHIRLWTQRALADFPVTRAYENPMRDDFQRICMLGDKYSLDNINLYYELDATLVGG